MERRIAAILAGDMVGYSRLTELDEAGTLARHRQYMAEAITPAIERMGGHIFKTTGDGMIAEFGSVIEAVKCAVAIQRDMATREASQPEDRRIQYRIAVNLGDVVFEDGDVFGEGVNIAARLEALAEPGGIVVSGTAYDLLKSNVDVGYRPLGEKKLKNIETPVRVYQVTDEPTPPAPTAKKRRTGLLVVIAATALIMTGAGWVYTLFTDDTAKLAALPVDDNPSIIVMPLDNLSADPAQDYFAAGFSDDITTDLSQMQNLFVFARDTAQDYAEKGADPRQIGSELGVKFLLDGSVRRVGDTLRINVQLIDGQTGSNLWAKRYDGSMDDVLTFQDGIIQNIIAILHLQLDPDQQTQQQAAETDNPQAYDAYLQGWQHYRRGTKEGFAAALPHLERAIELDPNYGRAYAALATLFWEAYLVHWHEALDLGDALQAAFVARDYSEKAMERPTALAHRVNSQMYLANDQHDQMMREINAAVHLAPNDPENYFRLAQALITNGQPSDAVVAIDRAMALNPRYPPVYLATKGMAYYFLKDYDSALRYLERAYARNPQGPATVLMLIATYARLDRIEDSKRVISDYESSMSIRFVRRNLLFRNYEDSIHLFWALEKGGMPH